jgi:voltage-gated potassium channel
MDKASGGGRASLRYRVFEVLERGRRRDFAARLFHVGMVVLILANVTAAVLATVPDIDARWGEALTLFDRACVAVFIAEYAARLWTVPEHPMYRQFAPLSGRVRFAATPLMLFDLVAILPFVLELLFPQFAPTWILLRLVRFLRLARYSPALATIGRVVAAERRSLLACVVLFVGLLLCAAAVMHLVEGATQPLLADMPSAMWWAVVTLTKLGNSEVVPQTLLGRLVAATVMLLGIGFFALPVAIIGRGFYDEIRRRDFVVTFGMIARVPIFATLDAATIAELVGLLKARKVAAGSVILRKGEEADAMYLIANGEVEVELPHGTKRLEEGDFFGEMALLSHGRRTATVTARRGCELLVLDAGDFDRLIERNAMLAATVRRVAEARAVEMES